MLVGIRISEHSEKIYLRWLALFKEILEELELSHSCAEVLRKPLIRRKTQFLGLRLALDPDGIIDCRVPFSEWNEKVSFNFLLKEMQRLKKTEGKNLPAFLEALRLTIQSRASLAFCSTIIANENELEAYFRGLARNRMREFLAARSTSPSEKRMISFCLSKIKEIVHAAKKQSEKGRETKSREERKRRV